MKNGIKIFKKGRDSMYSITRSVNDNKQACV